MDSNTARQEAFAQPSRAREKGGCMYKKRLFLRAPVSKAATLLVGRDAPRHRLVLQNWSLVAPSISPDGASNGLRPLRLSRRSTAIASDVGLLQD